MYNKIFTKILDSSVWLELTPTRIVWITLLAAMDEDGFCSFAAVGNVAGRARVTIDEAKSALEILAAPDAESSDPENEGRRIERVSGGWVVLNATKYRDIVSRSNAQEKTRERVRRFREKRKDSNDHVTHGNGGDTQGNENVTPSEAYTEAEANAEKDSSPKKIVSALSVSDQEEAIYKAYCRHVGKDAALRAIRKSVLKLSKANGRHVAMDGYEARKFLWKKAKEYSSSPAGQPPPKSGEDFRPHPATWFNKGRYFDDVVEWQKLNGNGGNHAAVSNGAGNAPLGVLEKTLARRQRERAIDENGDMSAGVENGRGDVGNIHSTSRKLGPSSVSSRDEEHFEF